MTVNCNANARLAAHAHTTADLSKAVLEGLEGSRHALVEDKVCVQVHILLPAVML